MTRAAVIGLLLFSAAVLQTALFPHLAIAGYRPDLLLLVTAAFALHDGASTGVLVGFTAGVVTDLLLVQPSLGLSTVVLVSVGYAVGLVRPYLAIGSVTAPVAIAFASGVAGTAGYGLLSRLLGDPRFTLELVAQASLMVGLYNTVLAPPAFVLVGGLTGRFPPQRTAPL
ncbi:MAG TPA: rod shape-determining protein MreD [Nitriliruptorales bacterium]|nr:rod shape-determining protein MreD [Nitriliruptorales bacterium]